MKLADSLRQTLELIKEMAKGPLPWDRHEAVVMRTRIFDAARAALEMQRPQEEDEEREDMSDEKVPTLRDRLAIIEQVTNIPPHKLTDTEFLRGSCAIAYSQARAALAAAEEGGWRHIATAPKDGTTVGLKLNGVLPAYWDNELETWVLCRPFHMESFHNPKQYRPFVAPKASP